MNGSTRLNLPACSARWLVLLAAAWLGAANARAQPGRPADAAGGREERYWSTEWEFDRVDVGQLLRRLESIGLDVGVPARGRVSASLKVGVPWTNLRDAAAYRFDGSLTSDRLTVDAVQLGELRTRLVYRDGVLKLTRLNAELTDARDAAASAGTIEGAGALELAPRGDLTAQLSLQDVDFQPVVDLLAKFFPEGTEPIERGGAATGRLDLRVPLESVRRIGAYELEGALRWRGVRLTGLPPVDVEVGELAVKNRRVRLAGLRLESSPSDMGAEPIRVRGEADLPVSAEGPFSFDLVGDDVPLAETFALAAAFGGDEVPSVLGKLDLRLSGSGALDGAAGASTWAVEGAVASPALSVAGFELGMLEHRLRFTPTRFDLLPHREPDRLPAAVRLREVRTRYEVSEQSIEVTEFAANLFDGKVSGRARLSRAAPHDVSAKLAVSDLGPVVRVTPVAGFPFRVSATISGDADWRAPLDEALRPSSHRGSASFTATDIRLGDAPVGELEVDLGADENSLSLESTGELFGGKVTIETSADTRPTDGWPDVARELKAGRFTLDGVLIGPLIDAGAGRRVGMSGELNGELTTPERSDSWLDAELALEVTGLAYDGSRLSRRVTLLGRVEEGVLLVDSLDGDYAGGSVNATGAVALLGDDVYARRRVDLRVSARRLQADRVLWFAGGAADRVRGRVTADATVTGDLAALRASGSVSADGLAVDRLAIGSGHSSLRASLDLVSFDWSVHLPSIRSHLRGGRLEGDMALKSARRGGFDLESRWRARRLDALKLSSRLGASGSIASGAISGDVTLGGKAIQSVRDFHGRFDLRLGRTRGVAIPGLIGVSRLLGPVSLAGQVFDAGAARGVIGRGAVVIDEFWLGSGEALVRADGKVYLAAGRLDLEAIVATGDYTDVAANLTQIAQDNAIRVLLPASAVLSVSELLRDRTLVVAVGGTIDAPIVRLRPVETFREEVARFLVREGQRLILAGFAVGTAEGLSGGR